VLTDGWGRVADMGTISSREVAEAFFRSMGCSHFHMSREYPERYAEYSALGVSKQQEALWRQAEFDEKLSALMEGAVTPDKLWWLHSYLSGLADTIRKVEVLRRLAEATAYLVPMVPSRTRILVAETLVGRDGSLETGPIHLACALDEVELAARLSGLVPQFCNGRSAPHGGPSLDERRAAVLARLDVLTRALPREVQMSG
jgi:hypothetical protein